MFLLLLFLDLTVKEVCEHVRSAGADSLAEGDKVQSREEAVSEAKEEHRGDVAAGILEGPAVIGHAVLLSNAPWEVVLVAGAVNLLHARVSRVGPLLALNDSEIVVGKEPAGVALSAESSSEHNKVLREGGVQNSHRAHRTASVVKEPLTSVNDIVGVCLVDLVDHSANHRIGSSVGTSLLNANLSEGLEAVLVKYEVCRVINVIVEADEGRDDQHNKGEAPFEAHG